MLTLYFSPGAASLCVHHLLIELGIEHRLQRVDTSKGEQKSEAYLKLNPGGVVPTLLVDEVPMVESAAMLMWLAANDSQRRFAPAPGSAEERLYLSWFLLLANGLQPAFRHWFYPQEAAGEGGGRWGEGARAGAHRKPVRSHRLAVGEYRCLPVRQSAVCGGFLPVHADALVAQHAASGHHMARLCGVCRAHEGATELCRAVRP
jgi:glutathione S-transferase